MKRSHQGNGSINLLDATMHTNESGRCVAIRHVYYLKSKRARHVWVNGHLSPTVVYPLQREAALTFGDVFPGRNEDKAASTAKCAASTFGDGLCLGK